MVRTRQSLLPTSKNRKKDYKPTAGALYHDIVNLHYDKFSEEVGIPVNILKKQSSYEEKLLDRSKDKDTFKSVLRTNRTATPIGEYMKKWVYDNYDKALKFLGK